MRLNHVIPVKTSDENDDRSASKCTANVDHQISSKHYVLIKYEREELLIATSCCETARIL